MGIQPIDLQTLFGQIEKVAKTQTSQKEGLQIQQSLQNVQIQKKTEERSQIVNESQNTERGAERITDRNARGAPDGEGQERENREEPEENEEKRAFFSDPTLGNNVDLSG